MSNFNRTDEMMIRFFDVVLSAFGILCTSPIMLLIFWIGVLDTGRPLFFQKRLGHNQVPFLLIKFRTMKPNTASTPTHLADTNAITRFGSFLRRTKLDELPQLWNVLIGEMSLVGPRPGLPSHINLTKARKKNDVFSVRPGITGLSQINRIDMATPKLLSQTDARMISEMSVKNYFKYIFLTLMGKGSGDRIKC